MLSQLTCIVWCAKMILDRGETAPFTVAELKKAGRESALLDLALKIDDSDIIEFASQTESSRQSMEDALSDAFSALEGQFERNARVKGNPLCLLIAIAMEAVQQKFAGTRV